MAYDIGPRVGVEGESQYLSDIKRIRESIKTLGAQMDVVTTSYLNNEKSAESLAKEQAILEKQIALTREKIADQATMAGKAAAKYGESAEETQKWERALAESQSELNKLKSKLSGVGDEMDALGKDTDDVGESLDDAGKAGLTFGDILKANVLSDAITSGIRALGDAVGDLARKFVDFAKTGVETASDLEEVQNVVDVTFGEKGAEQIEVFAQKAAGAFGMSGLSAKEFTGTMGAMLKSMGLTEDEVLTMSTDIVGLAGDMASFYNLDPSEAFAKLRSGISGETEPLKQLGINMSVANLEAYALAKGIQTAYKDMTQAEQATLRYNYLMETTADAQGDFARTSDSYANQQKILQLNMENLSASIGSKLIPTLTGLTSAVNGLLSGETDISTFVDTISGVVLQAAEGILANLPALLEAGGQMLSTLLDGLREMFPTILEVCGEILGQLIEGLVTGLPEILQAGVEMLTTLVEGIASSLPTLIPTIVAVAMEIVIALTDPDVLTALIEAGLKLIVALAEGLVKAIPELIRRIPEIIKNIVETLVRLQPEILAAGIQLIITLGAGLIEAIPELVAMIPEIIVAIVQGFMSAIGQIVEVGKAIVMGLWEGIKAMWNWVKEKVTGLFSGLVDGIKNFLGIHSPSRVFAQIGEYAAAGLGEGFEDKMDTVSSQMQKAIPTPGMELGGIMAGAVNGMQTAMAGFGGGGSYTINLMLPDGTTLARYQLQSLIDVANANGTPILNPA